jgi:hypothetical protein
MRATYSEIFLIAGIEVVADSRQAAHLSKAS